MWNLAGKKYPITELIYEKKCDKAYLHPHKHTHKVKLHIPSPVSTKLAMVFAAFEERKKLALSPSLSAEEKVL